MPANPKSIRKDDIVVVVRGGSAYLGQVVAHDVWSSPPVWTVRLLLDGKKTTVKARQLFKVLPQSEALARAEVLS